MNWKEKIPNHILATMRYVYLDQDKAYPKDVDDDEWLGKGTDTGVRDYIISLILEEIKKAFFAGYHDGAKRTYDDLLTFVPKELYTGIAFSEEENKTGAWKAWEEWQKEEEDK